jgi:hypothetical protein
LKNVHEWGSHIWVHTLDETKLDGRLKIGRWIGFEEISNGHQIYWPDKRSVTVKRSIKFENDKAVFLSNPIAKPIQGENDPINTRICNMTQKPEHLKPKITRIIQDILLLTTQLIPLLTTRLILLLTTRLILLLTNKISSN